MRKNIYILLLAFIVVYQQATAQKTGINKTNPTQALDVRGNIKGDSSLIIQPKSGNSDSTFIVTPDGRVGIRTDNPDGELDIHSGTATTIFTNLATNAASASGSSNTAPGGTASRAFDGDGTTDWYTFNSPNRLPAWLKYDFGTPTIINAYTLMQLNTYDNEKPTAWTFEGSNDNVSWTALDNKTGQDISNNVLNPTLYVFTNSTAYRYYRIYITNNKGSISHAGITEMQIGTLGATKSSLKTKNGNVILTKLGGSGSRMVVVSNSGVLSAQAIPNVIPFGSLSNNYVVRWNGSMLTNSSIYDGGVNIGIGTSSTPYRLNAMGGIYTMGSSSGIYMQDRSNFSIFANYTENNIYRIWHQISGDLVTVHTNGRMGIGVASPTARLHVAGDLQLQNGAAINEISTDTALADNSNLAVPTERAVKNYVDNQISSITETDPKIGTNTTNFLSKWNGTQLVSSNIFEDASNNVGIGTSTPTGKLDIFNGAVMLRTSIPNTAPRPALSTNRISGEIASYSHFGTSGDDGFLRLSAGGGTTLSAKSFIDISGYSVNAELNNTIALGTSGTERVRINSAGNIGIGTSAPLNKFHVNSNNIGSGTADWIAGNFGGLAGDRVVLGLLEGIATVGSHNNLLNAWSNLSINPAGNIYMAASSGNVGIGTTSPSAKLYVAGGNVRVENNVAIGDNFYVGDFTIARTGADPQISLLRNGSQTAGFKINGNDRFNMVTENANIAFRTGVIWNGDWNTTGTERMVITNGGNVGIGTAAPTQKLQVGVNGDGSVALANAWNTFSDARFKKNIRTLKNPLAKLDSLRGVRYDWISSGKGDIGFIAQELEKVYPELVATGSDGYKSVDYPRMTAILLQAIKELKAKNEILEAKDKEKSIQLEQHEAAISSLKKDIEFLMQFYSQK